MRRVKAMTWERHREVGSRLRQAQDYLCGLGVELGNTYGVNSQLLGLTERAERALRALRAELENRLYAEHGGDDGRDLGDIYFGAAGRKEG